jgi:hypothetical protein
VKVEKLVDLTVVKFEIDLLSKITVQVMLKHS